MRKSLCVLAAMLVSTTLLACSDSEQSSDAPSMAPAADAPTMRDAAPAADPAATATAPKDGELPFPDGYTGWQAFLPTVDRPDTKQVREIFMNAAAQSAVAGSPLPDGSVLVMEIYGAQVDAAGAPTPDASGRLQKGALSKVFVMAKNPGWGVGIEPANGSWVYSAFEADGSRATIDYVTCRACHTPAAASDFVLRLDEHFAPH